MKAWHIVGPTLRDGSAIPEDGVVLRWDGILEMCSSGLHASRRLIDALQYAPGDTICRVECAGQMVEDQDKLVCRERTILWRIDGEDLLRRFARRCALDVAHLWDAPEVVIRYLQTGDESLRAAARAAAWDAVMANAWDAVMANAWDAVMANAWDAVMANAWDEQNRRLTAQVSATRRSTL
jgi:hypothetical protein